MARNSVRYKIDADASGAKRGSREAERSVERMRKNITGHSSAISTALGVGLAGGAIAATGKMIQLASSAAEVDSKFKIVFGSTSQEAIKQLDEFSKATGASRYELKQQAADLQALIKPLGLSASASADMSTKLTELATDLSSFNNVPAADALEAIRAGLVGESEPLRRFGVQLSAARVEAEAFALGLAKPTKDADAIAAARTKVELATNRVSDAIRKHGQESDEAKRATLGLDVAQRGLEKAMQGSAPKLTAAQKAQAAYSLILKDTTVAQGDATRTSGSFANQQRRLQNEISDTATEMGQQLLPAALDVVQVMGDLVPAVTGVVNAAGGVGPIMVGAAGFGAFKAITPGIEGFNEAIGRTKGKIGGVKGVARAAGSGLTELAGGPMGLAALAAGGLALAVAEVVGNMTSLSDEAKDFVSSMQTLAAAQLSDQEATLAVASAQLDARDAHHRYNQAVAEQTKLLKSGKATKADEQAATRAVADAELRWSEAKTRVARAQQNAAKAGDAAASSARDQTRQLDGLTQAALNEAAANQLGNARRAIGVPLVVDQKRAVAALARSLEDAASSTQGATKADKAKTRAVIDLIKTLGRVPDKTETQIISNALAESKNAKDLKARLDVLDGRIVNIQVKTETDRETRRVLNSGGATTPTGATGMYVSGAYGADDTTIRVTGGEAVLNPRQIAMIGADRVFGALAATGAPTIRRGAGYKVGGLPPHWRGGDAHAPKAPPDRDLDVFLGNARLDELALASSTLDATDDRVAARKAANRVSTIINRGTYRGRRLSRRERRMLLEALGGFRRDAQTDPSSTGGGDDPFALDRAREAGVAEGLGRLSSYIFGGSGDIGTGGGGNALASAGTLNVARVVIAPTTANHAELAGAANRGNSTWNRTRSYSSREGVAW